MTMTRDKIEELKQCIQALFDNAPYNDGVPFVQCQEVLDVVNSVAERALEPQGQAHVISFKEEKHPTDGNMNRRYPVCSCGWKGVGSHSYNDDQYHQNQREADQHIAASQLALPAGPVPDPKHALQFLEQYGKNLEAAGFSSGDALKACRVIFETKVAAPTSPAVAQPVADARAEYERMLRAGYQHDNVRRQERGLASTDELTEGQEREIAERVALKFPSGAGLRKDSPVAFSCARRAAHPTSWTMTCDKHCGDDAKCFRAALGQPAEEGGKS